MIKAEMMLCCFNVSGLVSHAFLFKYGPHLLLIKQAMQQNRTPKWHIVTFPHDKKMVSAAGDKYLPVWRLTALTGKLKFNTKFCLTVIKFGMSVSEMTGKETTHTAFYFNSYSFSVLLCYCRLCRQRFSSARTAVKLDIEWFQYCLEFFLIQSKYLFIPFS